ncbi:MAG TPA: hypothetical protein VK612_02290 [Pyrinomonadaceae bacterium]|nr:hypothetical protein [Pyrinomonadaceae bacterium]
MKNAFEFAVDQKRQTEKEYQDVQTPKSSKYERKAERNTELFFFGNSFM